MTIVKKHPRITRHGVSLIRRHPRLVRSKLYSYEVAGLPGKTLIDVEGKRMSGVTKARFLKERRGEDLSPAMNEVRKALGDKHYPEYEERGGWFD